MLNKGSFITFLCFLVAVQCQNITNRAFTNPLNGKSIDLYIAVDEGSSAMNQFNFGYLKMAINDILLELNPAGSSPRFSVLFYGASSAVNTVANVLTSAATVKSALDNKLLISKQAYPSSLASAVGQIQSNCVSNCRINVPRVTILIGSETTTSAEAQIHQLEVNLGMTIMYIGIGGSQESAVLRRLASYPTDHYAFGLSSYLELTISAKHFASVASDVPRLISASSVVSLGTVTSGVYYTLQFNNSPWSGTQSVIMFGTNCGGCTVYYSLTAPIPTDDVASTSSGFTIMDLSGTSYVYLYSLPTGATRLYISVRGNGQTSVSAYLNRISVPSTLVVPTKEPMISPSMISIG